MSLGGRLARSHAEQPPTKPRLLPGAVALGADVVCVAKHPGTGPCLAMTLRALHPWIEMQRHDVEGDHEQNKSKSSQHGVPPSVSVNEHQCCRTDSGVSGRRADSAIWPLLSAPERSRLEHVSRQARSGGLTPDVRTRLSEQMSRLGGVILDRLSRPRDFDREAEELSRVLRRQQLCADLRRVEHLIATDTWMSATRQRGNRLAYEQLLDDLRHTPDVLPAIPGMSEINSWTTSASTVQPTIPVTGYGSRSAPNIEILEIGWRR